MSRVIVVRHGESTANENKVISGQHGPDVSLTDQGRAQAANAGHYIQRLVQGRPHIVVASPLRRAQETAHVIAHHLGAHVHTDPGFIERSFGSLEGDVSTALSQKTPGYILWAGEGKHRKALRANEHYRPPGGGESLEDVRQRASQALHGLRTQYPDHDLVIVSHGHTLKALHAHLTGGWGGSIPRFGNAETRVYEHPRHPRAESLIREALAC